MKRHIDDVFLSECEQKFNQDPVNIITRNAVVSVGSFYTTMNSNRINQINHVFLNTVKKKALKATNQGHSGRCWMFAALNTFRHMIIKALELENFEFSEVYLFFWDKLERSNSYINWFITHPEYKPGDRAFDYMISEHLSDGGWWESFANLVNKYGLIPQGAMKETFHSGDTDEMNSKIKELLDSCVNKIYNLRKKGGKNRKTYFHKLRLETMTQIYNTLVKFLGEPPKVFEWAFWNDREESTIINNLSPHTFKEMVIPNIDLHDFVTLAHVPTDGLKFGQKYSIMWTKNVEDGKNSTLLNVDTDDLARYAVASILSGMAVWFVGDIRKHFNFMHSTLDDQLDDGELIFGRPYKFQKGARITFRNVQGNHAMALTGVNVDHNQRPVNWQVENSWGYFDNEEPGMDGFLNMSHSWFKKYVIEIVVHKRFLSRSLQKMLTKEPILLEPWSSVAPATKAVNVDAPKNYINMLRRS